jgi:hypothetical protein
VGAFWADAENLFETARQASRSGSPDCDWAILIVPQVEIHMQDATGWALPSLQIQQGARTAYRVTREGGRVRLEGRHGSETCLLGCESPAVAARHLLGTQFPFSRTDWNSTDTALAVQTARQRPTVEIWKMLE